MPFLQTEEVAKLRELLGETRKEDKGYSREVVSLKKEIADFKIDRDRLKEKHQKEERELRHMIGLEKRRQEFEIEQARKETALSVREENLSADKARFEAQMEFTQQRFEAEVGYLKGLMKEILERLPNFEATVDLTQNGHREHADI